MRLLAIVFLVLAGVPALAVDRFSLCDERLQADCVVDGDTVHVDGVKIRLIDIDAPEISNPKCAPEFTLGQKAKLRLQELLNASEVEVKPLGARDHDVYGRKLRLVLVDGESAGALLVSEGLAAKWQGHHHDWCE